MRAKSLHLCPTLCNPMNRSPPGFSVYWILQARILEWVAMPSSRGSSRPRYRTRVCQVSCFGRQVLYQQRHLRSHSSFKTPVQGPESRSSLFLSSQALKKIFLKSRLEVGQAFLFIPKILPTRCQKSLPFQYLQAASLPASMPGIQLPWDTLGKCGPGFVLKIRFAILSKISQSCRMWYIKFG